MKPIKSKNVLSFIIFISIGAIFLIGYLFLEKYISTETAAIILFVFVVLQVLILQFFLKNQLKKEVLNTSTEEGIDDIKHDLQVAEKQAEQKADYLANMSYEVRTPLSTVLGMLSMLKATNLSGEQKAQVEIAECSSKHLLQLTKLITQNAGVNSDDIELKFSTTDLIIDLLSLFKVFEFQAMEKGLVFTYKFLYDKHDRFSLLADSERIQQVIINLFNNAVKFTDSGTISIIVDQSISIDDEQIVSFYIKDTGVGMQQKEVSAVFYDGDGSKNLKQNNHTISGLGLSVSKQLVKQMGGELKLESKPNEGSAFYFSLQLKKTLSLKSREEKFEPVLIDKFYVLVAEDNRMNQKVIKFLLERQGADCTFAKNGFEAVELYKILDFDMIFMDIYMPNMDGYEATKAIKETDKYLKSNTPIIAVSASAFEEDIANAKQAGIDDFLAKPIDIKKLKELLVKYSKTSSNV